MAYEDEVLSPDEDDGTMVNNVETLRENVVGRRIVKAEHGSIRSRRGRTDAFIITLDNGHKVALRDTSDCCAYTDLTEFFLHPDKVGHVIMGVGTTGGYTKWHIYASFGDILELTVGWSSGNPFYYGYGFDIDVVDIDGNLLD